MADHSKIIDVRKYSFNDWISIILSNEAHSLYPGMCFPSDEVKEEYLKIVKNYSDRNVKDLLRRFLIKSGRIEADNWNLSYLVSLPLMRFDEILEKSEYYKRNLKGGTNCWEGLTWVLELLPHHPKMSIQVLTAYFHANCQYMTDQQINGLYDCNSIIRAKYYEIEHPHHFLLQIDPLEFERLILKLYQGLGYEACLTKGSYDGGVDILIRKEKIGRKEKSVIQCKRTRGKIGISTIRELAGTVSDNKATKGILITTANFTPQAELFSAKNPRIELIDFQKLNYLLNTNFGTNWPSQLDYLLR